MRLASIPLGLMIVYGKLISVAIPPSSCKFSKLNSSVFSVNSWNPFRSTSITTAAQPKAIALAGDGTIFIAEINTIEAFRENQRVFHETPKGAPSVVAAYNDLIAIGGEVRVTFVPYFAI